ncbi:protein-methionine-sulfoxide reductase heme-binding subunit MsrQ [Leisingera caerulea]|uniref:Protein-methionine-sulfoxide reductase heme-binding subunit MsrQ n=1 Tax=Leisingera caerulea TaxID=506591 RepID=A0A9Q9HFW2_LEICA|nr:protein-methionine-sulfoxide reductase heme-binding subunit MsrQ [Leisingera caerulea]UWQ54033.1 protein-methionine-sulfoxide reductase heme-binding subunit MsrQ [Leisingera caerulea]UWQ83690.1 protein-methionine-sulfoxide reductase heme-binding subunit MsrQ [Leisingera caerulea]
MGFANQLVRRLPVWPVYLLGALPAPWLFYLGLTGGLGVEPIKALEHEYGELALQLLILTLAISPLRRLLGLNLLKFRRAIGLLCFFYVLCHLLVWLVLDVQILGQILTDIAKRPYITIGMGAFVLMLPLALTSNNLSVRKLGRTWSRLHRLTYAAAVLGAVHFVMLAKGFQIEPLIYLGLVLFLLALRVPYSRWLRLPSGTPVSGRS